MARLIICSAAETDYTESLVWYAQRSLDAANDFDLEFDRALNQIISNPQCYPLCDARHRYFLMRRFPFQCCSPMCSNRVDIAGLNKQLTQ